MNAVPKDQGMWNAIFSTLFLLLFIAAFWALTDGLDLTDWISAITFWDVAIISLATFRIIRLVTYDKIFAFVRNWFMDLDSSGTLVKPPGGPRRTIAELIECLWCTGLWGALFVTTLYFAFPIGEFFVVILAVAALGSFLQNFSQMIARIGN